MEVLDRKFDSESVTSPRDYLEYIKKLGDIPSTVVLCYPNFLKEEMEKESYQRLPYSRGALYYINKNCAVLCGIGLGAPVTGMIVEELSALGVQRIIAVGTAGSLSSEYKPGSHLLITEALCGEGVSSHYIQDAKKVVGSTKLLKEVGVLFPNAIEGVTWTTSAPYQETKVEIASYKEGGVRAVDMEAAALYAVSLYKSLEALSVFVVSDILSQKGWEKHQKADQVKKVLTETLQKIIEKYASD